MTETSRLDDSMNDEEGASVFAAAETRVVNRPGIPNELTKRIILLRADNPDAMTGNGTNTYIVHEPGTTQALIVDPGPDSPHHLDKIMEVCEENNLQICAIATTHNHPDHTDGIQALADRTHPLIFSRAHGNMPDGAFIPFQDAPDMRVCSLAGHSADSIGILFPEDHVLISGDVMFRDWSTIIAYPEGSLKEYFASLDLLEVLIKRGFVDELLPGHGEPIIDPLKRLVRYRQHRLNRLDEIKGYLRQGVKPTAEDVAKALYPDIDPLLQEAALSTVKSQLAYLTYRT